jgi:hypothetical protein
LAIDRCPGAEGYLSERLRAIGLTEIALPFDYSPSGGPLDLSDAVRLSGQRSDSAVFSQLSDRLKQNGFRCRFFRRAGAMLVMNKNRR